MVVHFLRLSSQSARRALNYRKFSTSNTFKQPKALRWVPLVIGGACVGCGAVELLYPKSITGYLPFISQQSKRTYQNREDAAEDIVATSNSSISLESLKSIEKPNNVEESSLGALGQPSTISASDNSVIISQTTESVLLNTATEEEVQPNLSDCIAEEGHSVILDSIIDSPLLEHSDLPPDASELSEAEIVFAESLAIYTETPITESLVTESSAFSSEIPIAELSVADSSNIVSETLESFSDKLTAHCEEIKTAVEPNSSTTYEISPSFEADLIESTIDNAMTSDPLSDNQPEELDEAQIIMEALNSLDYEPVLSDSVLDLLVGKAASREKAVVATISRLENSMASVVNEVQCALEHHNKASCLVAVARLNAQSVSEATNKEAARELLDELIESSSSVRTAFEDGEIINARVSGAFSKLSEVIEKAEQFNLQGPVSAARALLTKSRSDYYSACGIAQENQVDHALISHYQKSVENRKKILDRELEILRDHFPKQHSQLNQTFESADHQHAQVDELNTLITYLSNKVGRLENELEEQQTAELKKLKMVAEAQKEEDAKILEERLKGQAEQLKYQHELEQQTEIETAVAAARDESARHAAKQAQILKQEMTEVTERQIRDLTSFWSDEASLRESVVEVEYQCKLEKTNSLLSGVNGMLSVQSGRYQDLLHNLRLLNLTTALFDTINSGETVDEARVRASVSLLKSEFERDELVSAVSASIPDNVRVFTFSQLNERLRELDGKCRKVALVTTEDCGIGSHFLSRAMNFLSLVDPTYDITPSDGGSPTLYYLAKANLEMENNNLDLAARYLNQLVGEPRSLVQEWLSDVRTLLEVRQSSRVLLNYAKSRNGP